MLELAMVNSVNYGKTDKNYENNPGKMESIQEVMYAMSERLKLIAKNLSAPRKIKPDVRVAEAMKNIRKNIEELIEDLENPNIQDILALKNYWKYKNNQFGKIRKIEIGREHD